jgi:hypothetical protein
MLPNNDLEALLNLLASEKEVVLDSSAFTVDTIINKQNQRLIEQPGIQYKNPTSVIRFQNPIVESISPLNLLHSIGIITTPIIPNMVDISSTWAIIRYFWAFGGFRNTLSLSPVAKKIDFHQKGMLSDEIGVGMVYWIMHKFFNAISHIDVDVALRNPQIAQNIGFPQAIHNGTPQPDYLFLSQDGNIMIVESKGTQSGKSSSMDQIRRGLEQVPSIQFMDGTNADEYVIATSIDEHGTTVYIIDPPIDDDPSKKLSSNKKSFLVEDKSKLITSARKLHAAKLISFAGSPIDANQVAGLERYSPNTQRMPSERIQIPSLDADFLGQSFSGSMRGSHNLNFSVFCGLENSIYRRLTTREFISGEDLEPITPGFAGVFEGFQTNHVDENHLSAYSADKDGTIFYISVQGR